MYRILIVEDDGKISSIMEENFKKWGYETKAVEDFSDVLPDFIAFEPHMVLMDINLPNYDGFYWCARIREFSHLPIVFISSRDTDSDKIRAITQGGDDYIEKPFSMDLLIAKVSAILRRAYSYVDQTLNILQYKDMVLNLERHQVFYGDKETELTKNECKILTLLLRNPGKLVSRTRLMKDLWDDESFVDDNTLTVNVNRLRRKLDELGLEGSIKTIKGEGYRLL
ncbi:response regulator transcription factor [Sinanaerobacter chloroacetimidivorans]|jgi:DNA-binding response OmpR family regulator|uniref:Stage 0 sporulation protein A homolog n=1 Tax=Sinanaerobacter chloroacetimidivorans TaxID=2818044 RepID=A0A8J7W3U3_9FIRM|nr:response regulator transcription factor [Sinanaerobacter chloroacetimidivorans]MBR0600392.1 response regulator transcription factor [Sinanaerobacter chloroacetimidivorans]